MIIQLDEGLIVNTDCIVSCNNGILFMNNGIRYALGERAIESLKMYCTTSIFINNKKLNVELR